MTCNDLSGNLLGIVYWVDMNTGWIWTYTSCSFVKNYKLKNNGKFNESYVNLLRLV